MAVTFKPSQLSWLFYCHFFSTVSHAHNWHFESNRFLSFALNASDPMGFTLFFSVRKFQIRVSEIDVTWPNFQWEMAYFDCVLKMSISLDDFALSVTSMPIYTGIWMNKETKQREWKFWNSRNSSAVHTKKDEIKLTKYMPSYQWLALNFKTIDLSKFMERSTN